VTIEIVYETHSTTTDNESGIATGWLPGKLSERGRMQALELGRRRRDDGIAAICVSDLARAQETVQLAFADSPIPVVTDGRLRECNYGAMNGLPVAILEPERGRHVDKPWPEGESYMDVVARTSSLLHDLLRDRDGSRVLLVGHSANQWALDHLLLGKDLAPLLVKGMDWRPGWEYRLDTYTRASP
jgi:broad specificity phosphatase PhoE